jgi:hypothetical protein
LNFDINRIGVQSMTASIRAAALVMTLAVGNLLWAATLAPAFA